MYSALLGLAVFTTAFLVDVAWARAVLGVSEGRRVPAVLWSTLLYLLSMVGVLGLVADPLVAITAGCLGSAAGTYVGVGQGKQDQPTSTRTEHVPRAIRFLDQNTPTTDAPAAVTETPAVSRHYAGLMPHGPGCPICG